MPPTMARMGGEPRRFLARQNRRLCNATSHVASDRRRVPRRVVRWHRRYLNPTQPSSSSSPLSVGVSTTSPMAVAKRVKNPFCPSVTPFNVPLVVVVQPSGGVGVVVTAIRVQFFDTSGTAALQVTLPAPVPTTQSGAHWTVTRSGSDFSRDDRDRLRYRRYRDHAIV